jgi:hypothetical protein
MREQSEESLLVLLTRDSATRSDDKEGREVNGISLERFHHRPCVGVTDYGHEIDVFTGHGRDDFVRVEPIAIVVQDHRAPSVQAGERSPLGGGMHER